MRSSFKIGLPEDVVYRLLMTAYDAEVRARGGVFQRDDAACKNARGLAKVLTDDSGKFGILMCGKCGNGKTTLMRSLSDVLAYLRQKHAGYSASLPIFKAKDIIRSAEDDRLQDFMSRPILGIDDLGEEPTEVNVFGNIARPMCDLLEYRYENQLYTIATSNQTAEEISTKYKERVADRLREMMTVIGFTNESYRK